MSLIQHSVIINAPAEAVYDLIADCGTVDRAAGVTLSIKQV